MDRIVLHGELDIKCPTCGAALRPGDLVLRSRAKEHALDVEFLCPCGEEYATRVTPRPAHARCAA